MIQKILKREKCKEINKSSSDQSSFIYKFKVLFMSSASWLLYLFALGLSVGTVCYPA